MKKNISEIEEDLTEHDTYWAYMMLEKGHIVKNIDSSIHWRIEEGTIQFTSQGAPIITWVSWLLTAGHTLNQTKVTWISSALASDRYELVPNEEDHQSNRR